MHQSARDRGALHLATTELVWEMTCPVREPHELEHRLRSRPDLRQRKPLEKQRQADVFQCRHRRQEMEKLEDDPELSPPVVGQSSFIAGVQREIARKDLATGRRVESADEMHERAFSATARASDRDKFMLRDLERDVFAMPRSRHRGG